MRCLIKHFLNTKAQRHKVANAVGKYHVVNIAVGKYREANIAEGIISPQAKYREANIFNQGRCDICGEASLCKSTSLLAYQMCCLLFDSGECQWYRPNRDYRLSQYQIFLRFHRCLSNCLPPRVIGNRHQVETLLKWELV